MDLSQLRVLAVADLCITEAMYREAFHPLTGRGADLNVIEWPADDPADLRAKVDAMERRGPEAVSGPPGLEAAVAEVDVLVTHLAPLTARAIRSAARVKVIGCARSGWENVAAEAATARRIPVLNCPHSKVSTAADAAIGMMLAECRGLARAHQQMAQGIWDTDFAFFGNSISLTGNTVGMIGFGNIGKAVARRLSGFDVNLLVYDPFLSDEAVQGNGGAKTSLDDLLTRSDFVVLMARLTSETRSLIGGRELELMKETAFFINTARGGLVDYAALRDVLLRRRIAGAALDVFDVEPIDPYDPLLKLDNVTLTPHVAGVSREGYRRSAGDVAMDITRFLEGGRPLYVVNPETLS